MKQKTLEEQLAYLKGLGIKEINKATRLTTNKIEDILEKRFDKIDSVRAKGFLNILEREYDLDLSAWLREYNLFHNAQNIQNIEQQEPYNEQVGLVADIDIKQKVIRQENPQKKVSTNIQSLKLPEKKSKDKPKTTTTKNTQESHISNVIFFVFLCLIALGCVGYFGYRVFGNSPMQNPVEFSSKSQPEIVIVQPQETESIQDSQDEQQESLTQDSDSQPQEDMTQILQDSKNTYDGIYIDFDTIPQNPQSQISERPIPSPQELLQTPQMPLPQTFESNETNTQGVSKLNINPNSELWVGIVDLKNNKSMQLNLKAPYEIVLDRRYIFVFGHSDFESILDNQNFPHKTKNFVRFYFDGNELKEISYNTYKQLHPQENWQ